MADKSTHSTTSQLAATFAPARAAQSIPFTMSTTQPSPSRSIPQTMDSNYACIPSQTTSMARDTSKKTFDISSLMSPPEPVPYESFNQVQQQNASSSSATHKAHEVTKPSMPMSPPVSPYITESANAAVPATPTSMTKDPILYPRDDTASSPTQPPLFPSTEIIEHRRIVDEHIGARPPGLFREGSPPQREDYELALQLKSHVMKLFASNRRSWFEKERDQVRADRKLNSARWNSVVRYQTIAPAKSAPIKATKPVSTRPKVASSSINPKPDRVVKPQAPRPVRNSPPTRHVRRVSATPDPARRVVAPNREDRDFGALPDYCPPVSSLPDKPNCLKVDWKGAPIDLSDDPNIKMLHPDEASLAANLRLDCATYLTSKRRIFIRRLECARVGKEFRKTDAQQACKIDVNKASKLWTAFDKVGWLDLKWMSQFT
ncbi:SWIRM domain-containing protein [Colletotrichum truncatum]|uniref:SWIRM domain-containing protein n=1 Tax=Colletotrichum truncatum TaxID=5467 RepID=A0ACC3Z169_COLTU|nr:SWIRM domain-containing protein [Colletotrichum truncatum]KAF6800397.1 SWIRM domain-containing protein [Colletotrichum truncatum]